MLSNRISCDWHWCFRWRASLLQVCAVLCSLSMCGLSGLAAEQTERPNIILIVADDLGYGDLGCYGSKTNKTPHLDQLARDGARFTNFAVAQAVCTASRASFMTGKYANRIGLAGALNHTSQNGLAPAEVTLAEVCRSRGYATAIYGKWHLGHQPQFLPTQQGFDRFEGLPYSNDNGPLHPTVRGIPPLPWYEQERVVAHDPDQALFTQRLTDRAIEFISANLSAKKDRPFLVYLPQIMPHVPIFATQPYRGKSAGGLYGDVIEELDANIGRLLASLETQGLTRSTLVIFTSDNGPFLSYGNHAGSSGPFREGKLTTFEGGVRMPFLVRWPGVVEAGQTSGAFLTALDLLPSIAKLIGAEQPPTPLDGRILTETLLARSGAPERDHFLYYAGEELQAVRAGRWKLHFPHEYLSVAGPPGVDGKPANFAQMKPVAIEQSGLRGIASRHGYEVRKIEESLFDLDADPGEITNVAARHPEILQRLKAFANR